MKSIKTLVGKFLPSHGTAPSSDATAAKSSTLDSEIKMPAGLMEQLFPERNVMVSVDFGAPDHADVSLPAEAVVPVERPQSKSRRQGKIEAPEELSIPDELKETIFPKQKVMVSVLFNNAPKPLKPEPGRRSKYGDGSSAEHDFPIV